MSTEPVCQSELIEEGRLLTLTLSNGPSNEITPAILTAIGRTIDELKAMPSVRAVLIQGDGKVFSKGFDVRVIEEYPTMAAHRRGLLLGNDVCSRIAASRLPWIAAINGHCLGAGLELALACHLRLGIEGARFGLPELSRGLLPGLGGVHRLTRLVGRAKALELILSGSLISGEEALHIGLINRLIPKNSFEDAVLAFALNVISVAPGLVADVLEIANTAECAGEEGSVVETMECVLSNWQPRASE